jgi:tetratricopeptide (TPR) repeat protein
MSAPDFDISLIAKHWHRRTGFFGLLAPLLLLELGLLAKAPLALVSAAILTVIAVELLWRFSRALPKTKRGKIGFAISISSDDEKEAARIRFDFVYSLRRLLKDGRTGESFQVIEVQPFHSDGVLDLEDCQRLRFNTKSHFLLHGRVRVREIHGKAHHFIDIDGVVAHHPISRERGHEFAREFGELLPRKVIIPTDNDVFAFEFTSEWAEVVARYIIGVAAGLSGDFRYAEQLFRDLLERLPNIRADFPVYSKLKERVPKRLAEIHEARAIIAYERWAQSHGEESLDQIGEALGQIDSEQFPTPAVLNLNAIYAFLRGKSVARALEWLDRVGGANRNAGWHLNVAFLMAYERNLRMAIRHYRQALEQPIDVDLISKIEDFVYYIATTEPRRYQLYYCLGFFNWKVKGDLDQAEKDFNAFINQRQGDEFDKEMKLAAKWLDEIRAGRMENRKSAARIRS